MREEREDLKVKKDKKKKWKEQKVCVNTILIVNKDG
jgi:hypothetical protein